MYIYILLSLSLIFSLCHFLALSETLFRSFALSRSLALFLSLALGLPVHTFYIFFFKQDLEPVQQVRCSVLQCMTL